MYGTILEGQQVLLASRCVILGYLSTFTPSKELQFQPVPNDMQRHGKGQSPLGGNSTEHSTGMSKEACSAWKWLCKKHRIHAPYQRSDMESFSSASNSMVCQKVLHSTETVAVLYSTPAADFSGALYCTRSAA